MTTLALRGSGTPATTGTTWATVTNAVDGAAGTNPATYATMTNATASAVATIEVTGYDFASSIGASDTLNSVTVNLRHFENNTGRFVSVRFQPYDGATAIGTIFTATLATAARNDSTTFPVTLAQLRSATFKVRVTITGAASTQSRVESIDYIDVTADYTPLPPSITQAAYRFYADGTETGSTALAAEDTGYTADTSSGDVNLQVRVRLQSTNAVAIAATDDWQLQYERDANGIWTSLGAPEAAPGSNILASCTNATTLSLGGRTGIGQSFKGNGRNLTSAVFWLSKAGTPAATTITAYLYAHTGTYGSATTGTGTGSPLATSTNTVAVTSLNTANPPNTKYTFNFDGTFTLSDDTPYVILVDVGAAGDASNHVIAGYVGGPMVTGNASYVAAGVWSPTSIDVGAEVYTTAGSVDAYASANLTDAAATTNRLGAGTGSFVAGKLSEDGLVDDLGWTANNYTELLYSVTLKQADLAPTDTVRFRVLRNGATTGLTYTQVPTVTIGAGGPTDRTGTATGSVTLGGTASGQKEITGTAVGTLTVSGAASGSAAAVPVLGTATGALAVTGTSVGTRGTPGTASGSVALTGTAAGAKTVTGTASGTLVVSGTAAGVKQASGVAVATITLTGTAAGSKTVTATAAGSLTVTGTAAGLRVASGTATGSVALTGTAAGAKTVTGTASSSITIGGTATATKQVTGQATGQVVFSSTALGLVEGNAVGTATGTLTVVGLATGTKTVRGVAAGQIAITGLAVGTRTVRGVTTGTITLTGLAAGTGSAVAFEIVGEWNDQTVDALQWGAEPVVEWLMLMPTGVTGTATGTLVVSGTAAGVKQASGVAVATVTLSGVAVGVGETPAGGGTFAVVATSNTEVGASLGTANPIPAPAGVTTGDLLLAACGVDLPTGTAAITASAGWTEVVTAVGSATTRLSLFARVADGSGSDTLALTGPTQDYCAAILRITGHSATTTADIKSIATIATGHADPPSLNTGASRKWLWLAVNSTETSTADTITAMPTNYTQVVNLKSVVGSSTSVAVAVAQRNLETQTEDPGPFTHSTTGRGWVAATVAIPPGP